MIRIGGEFEINPNNLIRSEGGNLDLAFTYSSGRSALLAILNHLHYHFKRVIHLPFYICESVVQTCLIAKMELKFYEVDSNLDFPLSYIEEIQKNEIVLLVNYFGFIDVNYTTKIIKDLRQDITVIDDQVQSFWTYDNSIADYSFTSLRKQLPVPDGGLVKTNLEKLPLVQSLNENIFHKNKLIGSILKFHNYSEQIYLNFFEEGEKQLDEETVIYKGSKITENLYNAINLNEFRKARASNYKLIYELGATINIDFVFPYNENVIPLNVPIKLKNRNKVRQKLISDHIFLPIHWKISTYNLQSNIANDMSENELSLVIDHRYNLDHIAHQMNLLNKAIKFYE